MLYVAVLAVLAVLVALAAKKKHYTFVAAQ
jgi:hypothetical protein